MEFTAHKTLVAGMINLLLSIGEWPKISTKMINFLIIDVPSIYNEIIGRPSQATMEIVSLVKS